MIVTILCRTSPFSSTGSVITSLSVPSSNRFFFSGVRYRYLKPISGLASSTHATEKCGISS